jgi:nitrate reductase gamma subunit
LLVESSVAWVAARPAIVSVPEKPARAVGLALTEESLGEILRYVLIYMPGTAALVGFMLLYRRRAQEKRSRRESTGGTAP